MDVSIVYDNNTRHASGMKHALTLVCCGLFAGCPADPSPTPDLGVADLGVVDLGVADLGVADGAVPDGTADVGDDISDGGVETAHQYIDWNDGEGLRLEQPEGDSLDGYLRGGDFSTRVWASRDDMSWYLLHIVVGSVPTTDFARVSLPSVMGRDGSAATVLRVALLADAPEEPYEQIEFLEEQSVGTAGQTDPLDGARVLVEPVFYQREWIKFDPDAANRARRIGADEFYQIFWEAKAVPDYRLRVQLVWDDVQGLMVQAHDDRLEDADPIRINSGAVAVPINLAEADSTEGWHLLEVWLDRTRGDDSRWRVRFGGVDIVDYTGPLSGPSDHIINLPMFVQIYSDVTNLDTDPIHELVDDFEVWDAPPLDAWR